MGRPPRRWFVKHLKKEPNARFELIRGAFERRIRCAIVRAVERRIWHTPVHTARMRRKVRTHLTDSIAQRDHEVETLCKEVVQVLRPVRAYVDAARAHDANGVPVQRL